MNQVNPASLARYVLSSGTSVNPFAAPRLRIAEYEAQLHQLGRLTPFVAQMISTARRVRAEHEVVVYVAGALTGVKERDKQRYESVSDMADCHRKDGARMFGYVPHLHGTDPLKHPTVSPEEVRSVDFLWSAVVADFQLSFMVPIAHGNAAEAAWAEAYGIPVVYLVPQGQKLSRLMLGMQHAPRVVEYADMTECREVLSRLLRSVELTLLHSAALS